MEIKDIISHGKVYEYITKVNFNISHKDDITFNDFITSITKLKEELTNSNDDYNNILFLMLNDKYLINDIHDRYNSGISIYKSIKESIDVYRNALINTNNLYMNQRVVDLDNLEYIMLSSLDDYNHLKLNEDKIIICDELYPSYLIDNIKHIKGIITLKAGQLSHTAILARASGIPYVVVDSLDFNPELRYYLDTTNNILSNTVKPDLSSKEIININSVFKDTNIKIYANVFSNDDLSKVVKYNFNGIGLYRTEFIFMNSTKVMPTNVQYNLYLEAAQIMHPRSIVFRTFDIGDDKKVSYLITKEKGIGNYLNNIEMFKSQVEALVKANVNGNIQIMFPMIHNISEYNILKNIVLDIAHNTGSNVPIIGMMLETKEALNNLEQFKEVPFISLGTNDLTKELYNIDRENISRRELYYKDLLIHIKKVVEFTNKYNIKLSICGEIAAIPEVFSDLLSIGITNFSISTGSLGPILDNFNNSK